ncbi:hypothetical protein NDU88_006801 [Pleurodeles waltl]|uniref:Uncharacterized protein n=1 Tax=Pleurodeles waltl TaxID=8319 RepID=A0AAV7NRB6_PLEWA|nr:hypothetical protein NDU88_006801 [Pleurodeles waltl]
MQLGPAGPERTRGAQERLAAALESRDVVRGSSGRGWQQCTAVPEALQRHCDWGQEFGGTARPAARGQRSGGASSPVGTIAEALWAPRVW